MKKKINFLIYRLNKYLKYLFQCLNIKKIVLISIFYFSTFNMYSRSFDLLFMHTTMHIEPIIGIDLSNSKRMPYRMDEEAVFIFTPGIGIIYDDREDENKSGWSTIYGTHFNLNCYGTSMLGTGIGARYKFLISSKLNFNVSLMIEALIMTREFLPTYEWENEFLFKLSNLIMHDLPNTNYKIIFPTPIIDFSLAYEMKTGSYLNFNIMWSGVSIGMFVGMTIPAGNIVDKIKKANPPKRRKIRVSENDD